jgi:pimeloyl-ACP methyl ester carboxylesterase
MTDVLNRDDFLSFDGVRIGWHELGQGRPIILLHGLFSSGDMNWRKFGTAAEIASAGFRVIMPDFRAHGVSAAPQVAAAYPVDVLAMDIEALIRHLSLDDFDLGGYSLGARTAMRLLVRGLRPGRVVLSGMGLAGLVGGTERAAWFRHVIANADTFKPGTAEHAAAAFMKANHIDGVAAALLLLAQVSTPLEAIKAITTRALVLCGAQDTDNGSAAELAMALPNAALVEIPGNHMSAVTKADFGTAMAAWLEHA